MTWQVIVTRPAARCDRSMPYFKTRDEVQLHYSDVGDGSPVVLCHAWALNTDAWQYQVPDLVAAGHRVVALDRRGHGRSDRPGSGYDFDTFAENLQALLDHLQLETTAMVGHSYGCGEIVRLATRSPGRVTRAAFLAPIMPYLPAAFTAEELAANTEALKRDVPGWCADNAPPFFGKTAVSAGMVDWVTRQIVDTPLYVLLATMEGYGVDFSEELRDVDVPTLVLHGDADASAPLEHTGTRVAELVPDAELVVLPGSGHGLYAADHDDVNACLVKFLNAAHA